MGIDAGDRKRIDRCRCTERVPGEPVRISKEDAIALVRRLQDAVNSHQTSQLLDFYDEDAVVVSPAFKTVRGRSAIAAAWDLMFSTFPDWKISVSDVLVDGERVAALGTNTATDRKGWFGLPPTGGPISYRASTTLAPCWNIWKKRVLTGN
jgi:predicted ester cyclase